MIDYCVDGLHTPGDSRSMVDNLVKVSTLLLLELSPVLETRTWT